MLSGSQVSGEVCDDDDGIVNGKTTIANLTPGQYVLVETVAPDGFQLADDREVIVVPGQATNVTVIDEELPERSGFALFKEFEGGDLPDGEESCFDFFNDLDPDPGEIVLDEFPFSSGCTSEDGGLVLSRFQDPGDYVAVETITPSGYRTAPPTEFSIEGLEVVEVTVFNERADPTDPGTLVVNKTRFISGNPGVELPGACFQLFTNVGTEFAPVRGAPVGAEVCDDDDGEDDGFITLSALAGTYVLVETVTPAGFDFAVDRLVTIESAQQSDVTVTNVAGSGLSAINIFKVDENGDPLGDACFDIHTDAGDGELGDKITFPAACSNDVDGFVVQHFAPPGAYILFEVEAPDGYQPLDDLVFTHGAGLTTTLIVENEPIAEPTVAPTQAPSGPTPTTAVTQLPSTGAGPAESGGFLLLLALALVGFGATGWGIRLAVSKRTA